CIRNFRAGSSLLALLMLGVTGLWAANFRSAGSRSALGPRGMVFVGILALACVVMPPALLVITPKYGTVEAARFWAPYLTGYYSFLAWMVVLTLAFPVLALALRRWRSAWMAAMAFLGIGCASVTAVNAVAIHAISRTQVAF